MTNTTPPTAKETARHINQVCGPLNDFTMHNMTSIIQHTISAHVAAATAWRDISTAPKDGDDVMLLNLDRGLVLSMSPEHFWKTKDYPNHLRFFATHWKPLDLPTPPQTDNGGKE